MMCIAIPVYAEHVKPVFIRRYSSVKISQLNRGIYI